MNRQLQRELLDDLPADDPRAVASRGDLQRVNVLMGHVGIMQRALQSIGVSHISRLIELGAGDGTFTLQLAKQLATNSQKGELILVDQQKIVSAETQREFAALGWQMENVQADVFEWLARPSSTRADVMLANLFLHHFTDDQLRQMFALAVQRTNVFIACEPRRAAFPLFMTKLLWLVGCNSVTRHDADISVRAGFTDGELSRLWPGGSEWRVREHSAGLFSHCFVAQRT